MDSTVCIRAAQLVTASGDFISNEALANTIPNAADGEEDDPFVCAIIGAQGSGKSTLLNDLFKTEFPVLNAIETGPKRTTEGIWFALMRDPERKDQIVLLDVEGLDSKERGAAGKLFEHRVALFMACVVDVIILNLFAHDVGRKNSATHRVLFSVLEESFRLSGDYRKRKRATLIVAFRDYSEDDGTVQELSQALLDDLCELWRQVSGSTDSRLEDFYEIEFCGLHNKQFEYRLFQTELEELKRRITDRWCCYSKSTSSCSSFLALYNDLWTQISCRLQSLESDDSAISTSIVEPLIAFHCNRIVRHIIEDAREKIGVIHSTILEHFSEEHSIAPKVLEIHERCLHKYRWMARHFLDSKPYQEKEQELLELLWSQPDGELATLIRQYCLVVTDNTCRRFEEDFAPVLGGTATFEEQAQRIREKWSSNLSSYLSSQSRILGSVPVDSQTLQETCIERFEHYTTNCVSERRQQGVLMLPSFHGYEQNFHKNSGKRGLLQRLRPIIIRAVVIYLNYLQAKQTAKNMHKWRRRCDLNMPLGPTF
ncbi:Rhd3p [Cyanidiococcus yangmingshanensis]|uniref:Rhd3p n=1 Tax=Cyanidiococcus yangmingshanensis TaxID=2690220 RepID=A0A7J7IR88_9RHOD|nr:Rhd3p [Cyanidiococcus yangmingshanensis]